MVVGRVTKPDAIVSAVGSWTQLPLASGPELVRSIADESVADVVDLSQPLDAALTVSLSRRGVEPLVAFAVAVKSYEQAKAKLGETHHLVAGDNGQLKVEGLTFGKSKRRRPSGPPDFDGHRGQEDADDDDDGEGCVLAPAAQGGRLVCGEEAAVEALAPYLSRTMPREKWASDVHVEVRPEPVRAPLQELRSMAPVFARGFMGTQSAAVRELVDASIGELMDAVADAQKLTIDAQIADSGIAATTRFEFQDTRSLFARAATADRGDSPPASFWHLPADTDTAFFGRGSDPKLFDHPRELLGNLMLEGMGSAGMPEAERRALKDLVVDRLFTLFSGGTGVYGKGFDQAAVEKAASSLKATKLDDRGGIAEARRGLIEQVVGWHLVQVSEPIAKVGPILKDASSLWNRPAFTTWARSKSSAKPLPRLRVAPMPAGVALPKETVHLEIMIPRDDIEADTAMAPLQPAGRRATPAPKPAKKTPVKPYVAHVFAVPDGAATWLGIGLDAKLVAQKAAASLASAPDTNTLGRAAGSEVLREGKINGGGILTMRGFLVLTAFDRYDRTAFSLLGGLPHKGTTPIVVTSRAEPASETAKGGASVGSLRISRAVIEDMVKLAISR